jgi:colicin import membrane protein
VALNVDGTVRSKVLSKSSGVPAWDDAVLNAIGRMQRMPPDATGQVPPVMIISFRPKA